MAKANKLGGIVNRAELANICGVSLPTIDDWVRRGCPIVSRGGRGKAWEFNTADVQGWRIADEVARALGSAPTSEKDLKLRRMKALTELDELELAKARGEVAPLDEIRRVVVAAFAEVRASLLVVPARLAPQLIGEIDERSIKAAILTEIRLALEALANNGLVAETDFDDQDEGPDA